jgi:hypothetical protein
MIEAARTSETLVNFYQTTRRYNPEDSHLRTHRREIHNFYSRSLKVSDQAAQQMGPVSSSSLFYLKTQAESRFRNFVVL